MKLYDWIIIGVPSLLMTIIVILLTLTTIKAYKTECRQAEINRALNMVEEMRGR